jgi:HAD superfamily hydrolase (TIGR01544 family)
MEKNIVLVDEESLKRKIGKIKKDGASHLHVVSDFDRTLTPGYIDGRKPTTSFAQIREGKYLPEEYFKKANALFEHYYPIETSNTLSVAEKRPHMKAWWKKHLDLMVEYGLKKEHILDIIAKKKVKLREGARELFSALFQNKVPFLIFSAGIGDIIQLDLQSEKLLQSNVHIISNFFSFDSKGYATGYQSDVIHIFNKDEGQVKNSPYHEQIKNKKNVLLLGDTLGDVDMLEGLSHETVIKVGFLNEGVKELLPQYKKAFDVVILDDGPMDYVNDLLKQIL